MIRALAEDVACAFALGCLLGGCLGILLGTVGMLLLCGGVR